MERDETTITGLEGPEPDVSTDAARTRGTKLTPARGTGP